MLKNCIEKPGHRFSAAASALHVKTRADKVIVDLLYLDLIYRVSVLESNSYNVWMVRTHY